MGCLLHECLLRRRRLRGLYAPTGPCQNTPRCRPCALSVPADLHYNKETMRAAFLTGVRSIEVRETPAPRIARDDDVLVRSQAVGVCGSDLHYYLSDSVGADKVKYPFIPGHECAGVVTEVGRKVARVKPGDTVVIEPAVSCGNCDQCRTGRPHTCRKLLFLGHYGELTGGMAEFTLAPERNCVPLPSRMTAVQGALAEPLSIALYATGLAGSVRGKSRGRPGDRADRTVRRHGPQSGGRGRGLRDREGRGPGKGGRARPARTGRGTPTARTSSARSWPTSHPASTSSSNVAASRPRSTRPSPCSSPAARSSSSASRSSPGSSSTPPRCGARRSASRTSGARTGAWRRPWA